MRGPGTGCGRHMSLAQERRRSDRPPVKPSRGGFCVSVACGKMAPGSPLTVCSGVHDAELRHRMRCGRCRFYALACLLPKAPSMLERACATRLARARAVSSALRIPRQPLHVGARRFPELYHVNEARERNLSSPAPVPSQAQSAELRRPTLVRSTPARSTSAAGPSACASTGDRAHAISGWMP